MRLTQLWPAFCIALVSLAAGCGGGGSSNTVPAASTTAPPSTPTPPAGPGALQIAYTSTFGASSAATAAPAAVSFLAETQTVSVTASQANNSTGFSAAVNTACGTNVTVAPATSTTGAFTVTAVGAVAASASCAIVFTGASGTSTVSLGAVVPAPGGVQVRWVGPGYQNIAPPVPLNAGPVNMIGTGALFATTLVVSETAYVGTFVAPALSAGCAGGVAAGTPTTTTPSGLPTPAIGTATEYITLTASAAIASGAGCTVTVQDHATPQSSGSIGVNVTTATGGIQ